MYSKINQIRYELQKLYESQGLTDEVLKLSRKLDEEINKIQKEKGNIKKTTN
ncbi:aspartyl-phosphate phosphatase Spo0E family protein [uncultured Clostridium sp.]|uniref:aspartyl-phosphate phosphatase Spo0E family protein n=1 Tax=uncultured Clostridium sp. TaxID=59620 RepID=UPI0025DCDB26|nr:aspartyl-phosphate phosphatase Spo0E family protein [uncultured Clostridium sp.]